MVTSVLNRESAALTEDEPKPKGRRDRNAVFARFPDHVIEALDYLVGQDRIEQGASNRSMVIRRLILEAARQRRGLAEGGAA